MTLPKIDRLQMRGDSFVLLRRQESQNQVAGLTRNCLKVRVGKGAAHGCVLSLKADKMLRQSAPKVVARDVLRRYGFLGNVGESREKTMCFSAALKSRFASLRIM